MLEKSGDMRNGRMYAKKKKDEKCVMYITFPWSLLLPAGSPS
jgi:hypothetical protein